MVFMPIIKLFFSRILKAISETIEHILGTPQKILKHVRH
jgi:hypothetical protein